MALNDDIEREKRAQLYLHEDESDSELRAIVSTNMKFAAQLPNIPEAQIKFIQWMGEAQACQDILEERARKRKEVDDLKSGWKAKWEQRKKAAILNLPNAISPNGQLVAAILEDEDKLTFEELFSWCDELAELDEGSARSLLDGLIAEGIVVKNQFEETYSLRTICDERLRFVPNDRYPLPLSAGEVKSSDRYRTILELLERKAYLDYEEGPMCGSDFPELIGQIQNMGDDPYLPAGFSSVLDRDIDLSLIQSGLDTLGYKGVLHREFEAHDKADLKHWRVGYYWFAMLGEKGE